MASIPVVRDGTKDIRGDLQVEIMKVLWTRSGSSVEGVRSALPASKRGAYNTVQTVLNRLTERGLVTRRKEGRMMVYEAAVTEADYVSGSLHQALDGASETARKTALLQLVEVLSADERAELGELAREIDRRRRR